MTSVHVSLSFILDSAKSQQFPKSSSAIFVLLLPQACVVPSFPVLGYSYKDALSGVAKKYFHQVILNISSIISFLCHQLVHSNLIFLNKSCKCYVLYASATVIQHFIFCRLKAIFFKCRNARSNIIPKTLIWHFFSLKESKQKTPTLEASEMEVSQSCFSRGPCKLSTAPRGQAEEDPGGAALLTALPTRCSPQSRAGAPLALRLGWRVRPLFPVRWPACPQHYWGTETLNLSAPAECLALWEPSDWQFPGGEPSLVEHPVPRCRLLASSEPAASPAAITLLCFSRPNLVMILIVFRNSFP